MLSSYYEGLDFNQYSDENMPVILRCGHLVQENNWDKNPRCLICRKIYADGIRYNHYSLMDAINAKANGNPVQDFLHPVFLTCCCKTYEESHLTISKKGFYCFNCKTYNNIALNDVAMIGFLKQTENKIPYYIVEHTPYSCKYNCVKISEIPISMFLFPMGFLAFMRW